MDRPSGALHQGAFFTLSPYEKVDPRELQRAHKSFLANSRTLNWQSAEDFPGN